MKEKNISQEFRLKNIEIISLQKLLPWRNRAKNEFTSRKYKKVCATLNYLEQFPYLASTITGCISISAFAFLLGIPIGITSSAVGLKICAITGEIKKYKSIIKKKKKKRDIIVLLAKSKLNNIEVLTSKALINSNISHHEFALINNVLKEYDNK